MSDTAKQVDRTVEDYSDSDSPSFEHLAGDYYCTQITTVCRTLEETIQTVEHGTAVGALMSAVGFRNKSCSIEYTLKIVEKALQLRTSQGVRDP